MHTASYTAEHNQSFNCITRVLTAACFADRHNNIRSLYSIFNCAFIPQSIVVWTIQNGQSAKLKEFFKVRLIKR